MTILHSIYDILLPLPFLNHLCRPSPPQRLAPGHLSPPNTRRARTSKWISTIHNTHYRPHHTTPHQTQPAARVNSTLQTRAQTPRPSTRPTFSPNKRGLSRNVLRKQSASSADTATCSNRQQTKSSNKPSNSPVWLFKAGSQKFCGAIQPPPKPQHQLKLLVATSSNLASRQLKSRGRRLLRVSCVLYRSSPGKTRE